MGGHARSWEQRTCIAPEASARQARGIAVDLFCRIITNLRGRSQSGPRLARLPSSARQGRAGSSPLATTAFLQSCACVAGPGRGIENRGRPCEGLSYMMRKHFQRQDLSYQGSYVYMRRRAPFVPFRTRPHVLGSWGLLGKCLLRLVNVDAASWGALPALVGSWYANVTPDPALSRMPGRAREGKRTKESCNANHKSYPRRDRARCPRAFSQLSSCRHLQYIIRPSLTLQQAKTNSR